LRATSVRIALAPRRRVIDVTVMRPPPRAGSIAIPVSALGDLQSADAVSRPSLRYDRLAAPAARC